MDKEKKCEGFTEIIEENRVGEFLKVGSKVIIPVIKIFIAFCGKEKMSGGYFSIVPYAVIVVDQEGERIFSLCGEGVEMEDIINETPGLMEKIKEVKHI